MRGLAAAVIAVALLVPGAARAAGTVEGVVLDAASGEPIPFASIYIAAMKLDLETDEDGTFSITNVPEGPIRIVAAAAGYRRSSTRLVGEGSFEVVTEIRLRRRGRNQTVVLSEPTWEVVVRSGLPEGGSPSRHTLNRADLETAPGALGDPLRAVQKLPGVSGDEGSRAWLRVRGGLDGELQVEIDGIAMRHLTHADGIVSMFHRDLVQSLTLHTAGTPVDHPGAPRGGSTSTTGTAPTTASTGPWMCPSSPARCSCPGGWRRVTS
jgi:hypothetical protein